MNTSQSNDLIDVVDGIDWVEVPASKAGRVSRRNGHSPGHSTSSGDYVWYDPFLVVLIDQSTTRSLTAAVRIHDPDLPHVFVLFYDSIVSQRLENLGNTTIVSSVAALSLFVVDDSMYEVPTPVPAVHIVAVELKTVSAFLESAGVPSEGVAEMDEAVPKLASVVSSHSIGSNTTVSADVLDSSASK